MALSRVLWLGVVALSSLAFPTRAEELGSASTPASEPVETGAPGPRPEAESARVAAPEPVEVAVVATRKGGTGRVVSDATSRLIVGAEGDPLRAVQALPGAVPIFAASPFMGFRASPPAKVGYEYDGIRLPYLYHLGLAASVVHPWLVDSASTYSAGPARLGQGIGGFLEAKASVPEGRARAEARARATESAAGVEVPFTNGRGSVLAAGRYSYMEPLVSLVAPEFRLDYWDYQGRVSYEVSERDTFELLALGAGDLTQEILDDGSVEDAFHGSFHRARLAWSHRGEKGARSRVSLLYSHDRWDPAPNEERPHANSLTLRGELTMPISHISSLAVGSDLTVRSQYDEVQTSADSAPFEVIAFERDDLDASAWAEWIYAPTSTLTMAIGLRADVLASGASPVSEAAAEVSVSPRQSISYRVHPRVLIRQSVGMQSQRPSDSQRAPGRVYSPEGGLEQALLADLGVDVTLPLQITASVTGFAGALFNVDDVDTFTELEGQPAVLERGQGRALGLEASLSRVFGRHLRGLVAYTLSRADRSTGRFQGPARFDRTHVLSVAALYDFGRGWSVSSRALYYSGFPGRMATVAEAESPPRSTPYLQFDVQGEKRWLLGQEGAFVALTVGMLNAGFRKDSTDLDCTSVPCEENMVGPASIPTLGVTGSL